MDKQPSGYVVGMLAEEREIACLLGEFLVRWSMAEFTLLMPIIRASGVSQQIAASMLAATNSAEGKIKLVKSVVANSPLDAIEKKAIAEAVKALERLCDARNGICHHLWAVGNEGGVFTLDHRKSVGADGFRTRRSPEELRELCNSTVSAAVAICKASGSAWANEETIRTYAI